MAADTSVVKPVEAPPLTPLNVKSRLAGTPARPPKYAVTVKSAQPGNLYNGQKIDGYDDRALRVQALYKPDASFSALFNVHGRDLDGSSRLFRANIIKPGTNELVSGFDPSVISTNGKNTQQPWVLMNSLPRAGPTSPLWAGPGGWGRVS